MFVVQRPNRRVAELLGGICSLTTYLVECSEMFPKTSSETVVKSPWEAISQGAVARSLTKCFLKVLSHLESFQCAGGSITDKVPRLILSYGQLSPPHSMEVWRKRYWRTFQSNFGSLEA